MLSYLPILKTRHILWMDGFLRIKRHPSWHKIRRCGRSTCWGLVWPLTEEIRVKEDFLREVLRRKLFGNSESSWMKFEAWSTPGFENGASKIAIEWTIDLGYSWMSWTVHFQINPPLFKLCQSSSNVIICRSSFRSSFGEDRVTGLGWAFIWASKDCQVQIFLMLLGVQLRLYLMATTMTIIPIRCEICMVLVRWCFPDNFLVSIFSIYLGFAVPHLGQSHISSHILFRSLIVVKITMASSWRHEVGCEGESSENFLYFRLVNYNGDDSSHCSSIGLQFFFEKQQRFLVWMTIFGWWFTLHESFENGSQWTIPPKNWTVSDPKETSRVQNSAPNQRSPRPYVPCLKLGWSAPCRAIVTRPGKSQAFEVVSCKPYTINFLVECILG